MHYLLLLIFCALALTNANAQVERGQKTLDSLYKAYSSPGTCLLRENFPHDESFKATYLASEEQQDNSGKFSYLWPFSGTFSAVNALLEATGERRYKKMLKEKVLPGLEEYWDTKRSPAAYSSYLEKKAPSDRFYDDNIWIGIDFCDSYRMTGNKYYIEKAREVWQFVLSGEDDKLGGGIYWCEQKKHGKNSCSNAPAAVFALKLYEATRDDACLHKGLELYDWTKKNLEDTGDYLYIDNISLTGKKDSSKYAYNSGQMMQAAALLYRITKQKHYLTEAQNIARACHERFFFLFTPAEGQPFRLLKEGNIWFTAVMLRGFAELYRLDHNTTYLTDFQKSMDYAWTHAKDAHGLFETDWSGKKKNDKKWLLTQAAFVEMFARLASALNSGK